MDSDKPLRKISEAFNEIANSIQNPNQEIEVELAPFSHACSLVSPLFRCLGIAFKFAEIDYVAKVLFFLYYYVYVLDCQLCFDR